MCVCALNFEDPGKWASASVDRTPDYRTAISSSMGAYGRPRVSRDVTTWRQVYPGEKSEKVIKGCCRHFVASGVPGQPDTFLTTILFLFHCLWNADEKIFRTENNVEEWFRSDRKLGCVIKHQFPSLSLSSTPTVLVRTPLSKRLRGWSLLSLYTHFIYLLSSSCISVCL